jgi:hypothetical protein
MGWHRLGHLYGPDGSRPWARSHAALPCPVLLDGDRFRVFFSARDAENRSAVGWVDIALDDSPRALEEGKEAILSAASAGHFDDSGIGLGSIVQNGDGFPDRLYYMGWNLGVQAPWRNSIGIAVGDAAVPRFERLFAGPLMDRSPEDPYTLSYPWVLRLAPDDWRMWYGSNLAWGGSSADMQHAIKAARSSDGLHWIRDATPTLGFSEPGEYAMARPCVVTESGGFRMWFASRGERYRIGAALSEDGRNWTRCDETAGLAPSGEGWESEMVCYPCAIRHRGRLYLFYNGNNYGKDGFGLAVWDR